MTNLAGDLRRWSELEPERCKQTSPHDTEVCFDYQVAVASDMFFDVSSVSDPIAPSVIQSAVQSAIEARGWWFSLKAPLAGVRPDYRAIVSSRERLVSPCDAEASNPAEALLSAYIKALEAERAGMTPTEQAAIKQGEKVWTDLILDLKARVEKLEFWARNTYEPKITGLHTLEGRVEKLEQKAKTDQ